MTIDSEALYRAIDFAARQCDAAMNEEGRTALLALADAIRAEMDQLMTANERALLAAEQRHGIAR